jgi:hypothetical protein
LVGEAGLVSLEAPPDESLSPDEPLSAVWWSLTAADDFPRLSVTYQPLPLNTTGGACRTRFAVPFPHTSQVWVVSAEKLCRRS